MTDTRREPEWSERARRSLRWVHSKHVSIPVGRGGARAVVDRTALDGSGGAIYPEITGYTLSVLESVIALDGGTEVDIDLARRTAVFLDRMVRHNDGAVLGPARDSAAGRRRYTFDTGMALKGLAAHLLRARAPYYGAAAQAVTFLNASTGRDGEPLPFGTTDFTSVAARWSTRPGPYLLKATLGRVCGHYAVHGDPGPAASVGRSVALALRSRDPAGMFVVEPARTVHMHAHLYACEAAYLLGVMFGIGEAGDAAYEGVCAALRLFATAGHLPAMPHAAAAEAERSDTVAQLLRLCLLLPVGAVSDHRMLADRLAHYQHAASGGIQFGSDCDENSGTAVPRYGHLSTHATLFTVQAWFGLASQAMVNQWRERPWTFA